MVTPERRRWEQTAQAIDDAALPYLEEQANTELAEAAWMDRAGISLLEAIADSDPEAYGLTAYSANPYYDENWEP